MQQKGYHSDRGGGSGTTLDPIADHSIETDEPGTLINHTHFD